MDRASTLNVLSNDSALYFAADTSNVKLEVPGVASLFICHEIDACPAPSVMVANCLTVVPPA